MEAGSRTSPNKASKFSIATCKLYFLEWGPTLFTFLWQLAIQRLCLYVTQMYFIWAMEKWKSESQIANKEMQMNLLKYISSLFCFWLPVGIFSCLSALKLENKMPLETKQSELKCVYVLYRTPWVIFVPCTATAVTDFSSTVRSARQKDPRQHIQQHLCSHRSLKEVTCSDFQFWSEWFFSTSLVWILIVGRMGEIFQALQTK